MRGGRRLVRRSEDGLHGYIYLLYQYKSTNTDFAAGEDSYVDPKTGYMGIFTCFTSTKVQILTHEEPAVMTSSRTVQILIVMDL